MGLNKRQQRILKMVGDKVDHFQHSCYNSIPLGDFYNQLKFDLYCSELTFDLYCSEGYFYDQLEYYHQHVSTLCIIRGIDITQISESRDPPLVEEAIDLVCFLRSAKEDLCIAAAHDHIDIFDQLEKVIEAPLDDHQNDLAHFLRDVFSADTKEAIKKARLINADDLVYGNTLGRGGQAKVVKASWKGISGLAVKENRVREYHDKEVDAMLGISHPNVMHLIAYSSEEPSEAGIINQRNVLLMEKMESDLEELIADMSSKPPSLENHLSMLLQSARGVEYLHKKKIVHRDLKPANILVDKKPAPHALDQINFTLKIADFASSRSPFDHTTMATAPIGTDMYMAPEILRTRGNKDLDASMYGPEVDIYSFAMICYKVLTGLDPGLAWVDVLEGKRPPLQASARCPQALVSFIEKCWHQNPDKRPSSSQVCEFLLLLRNIYHFTEPAHETCCLAYGTTNMLLEKLVSILGQEWLETEARTLEEGTSEEDLKLHGQVTKFLSGLSKKPPFEQIWNYWLRNFS